MKPRMRQVSPLIPAPTLQQIDAELPNCLRHLRNARMRRDDEAEDSFQRQLNRLLALRLAIVHPDMANT